MLPTSEPRLLLVARECVSLYREHCEGLSTPNSDRRLSISGSQQAAVAATSPCDDEGLLLAGNNGGDDTMLYSWSYSLGS